MKFADGMPRCQPHASLKSGGYWPRCTTSNWDEPSALISLLGLLGAAANLHFGSEYFDPEAGDNAVIALIIVAPIIENMSRPAERVVAFYNQRGTAEQWIKEGKNAIKWTRLSCRSLRNNAVRLQLHALAYNLGNFMRTLALPDTVEQWSLTPLRELERVVTLEPIEEAPRQDPPVMKAVMQDRVGRIADHHAGSESGAVRKPSDQDRR